MLQTHAEVERKFEVDDAFAVPELSAVEGVGGLGPTVELALDSVYVDTADLRLAAAGITLRRRTGGTDAGWHLKLPVADDERLELQAPLGSGRRPPVALLREVRSRVRDAPLSTVATIRTARVVHRLLADTGEVLAEICDDRVSAATADEPERRWREVEVELVAGGRGLLSAVGTALFAAGAHPARTRSKLGRALDERVPPRPGPPSGGSAGAVVVRYIAEQVDTIVAADPLVRADEHDAVHQMRVAGRRLRSALTTYRPLFDRDVTEPIRAELKWLGTVLGPARDLEVLRERLTGLLAEDGVADRRLRHEVERGLVARRREARRRLLAELDGTRYFRLLDALDTLVADPPLRGKADGKAGAALPPLVARSWKRLRRAVDDALAEELTAAEQATRLHEARKLAKQARYAAEAVQPRFGKPAKRFAKGMTRLQTVLGDAQDSSVGSAELAAMAGVLPDAFALGRAQVLEEQRWHDAVADFGQAWAKASRPALRAWLR